MASRKDAIVKATQSGTEVREEPKAEELTPIDTAEHQAEVLTPSHTEIQTFDGKTYFLPNEFTLRDIFRNRVDNALLSFVSVANLEFSKLGVNMAEGISNTATSAVLLKESVQNAVAELLHIVLKKPTSEFDSNLDATNLIKVWVWVLNTFAKKSTGDSNPKN